MIHSVGIAKVAALGAITAVLWLSPAAASDQSLPGATVESVVAVARHLNLTVGVQLDLLKLKVERQAKYAELERLAGCSL